LCRSCSGQAKKALKACTTQSSFACALVVLAGRVVWLVFNEHTRPRCCLPAMAAIASLRAAASRRGSRRFRFRRRGTRIQRGFKCAQGSQWAAHSSWVSLHSDAAKRGDSCVISCPLLPGLCCYHHIICIICVQYAASSSRALVLASTAGDGHGPSPPAGRATGMRRPCAAILCCQPSILSRFRVLSDQLERLEGLTDSDLTQVSD
jgi:hypothetical protein